VPSLKSSLACDGTYATWVDPAGTPDREILPINCVTWYEAFAFCAWDGGRLPTEAEWNAAAAGGEQQRVYPFGAAVDDTYSAYECAGDHSAAGTCAFTDIQGVGSRSTNGDGRWGHADLAGNVAELVIDWFAPYVTPCSDCATLTQGAVAARVVRGGDFVSSASDILASVRAQNGPGIANSSVGFRCARAP
jgi:formylglycine-generating enzyme required for sulfatase activity